MPDRPHRVVVVGGGFGGIRVVHKLRDAPVEVLLIDRVNYHLFQPLTYQVATGGLSPGEVAYPLRALFTDAPNVSVLMAEVIGVDLDARTLQARLPDSDGATEQIGYDTLVVATGSSYSYFGHEEWARNAHEVKSLTAATDVRSRLLEAFELAEARPHDPAIAELLTFVVIGAGPTGVEMAGQIGELARDTLRSDFRHINPMHARIYLLEMDDRVLGTFPPKLSHKAEVALTELGVSVRTGHAVVGLDEHGVDVELPGGGRERIPSRTVVWAAGVSASPIGGWLGGEVDRAGRLTVERDLTVAGRPEVIALGDMVRVRDKNGEPETFPGVAPVAIQQGQYAGRLIADRLAGRATAPFHYRNKGNLATIGRRRAVADIGPLHVSGTPAWLLWAGVHLWYLVGFQNRLLVFLRWAISFYTRGRGARLITRR